jgi:hypothetical protein
MASKPNDTGTSSKGMSIYTQKNKDTVEEISNQQPKKRKANPQRKECNAQVKSPIKKNESSRALKTNARRSSFCIKVSLNRFPPAIIHLRFQLATDRGRNRVRKPYVAQESVIPLLVKDKLAVAAKTWVDFAVAVEVWGVVP